MATTTSIFDKFSFDKCIEKVKLKLNTLDYDGDISIPDDVVRKHLETAKTLIDSVFRVEFVEHDDAEHVYFLYEECVTEYAKYLLMVSWVANAIDVEKTPGTWATVLKNERLILRALLLQLLNNESLVDWLLGEVSTSDLLDKMSIPQVTGSFNMLLRPYVKPRR